MVEDIILEYGETKMLLFGGAGGGDMPYTYDYCSVLDGKLHNGKTLCITLTEVDSESDSFVTPTVKETYDNLKEFELIESETSIWLKEIVE